MTRIAILGAALSLGLASAAFAEDSPPKMSSADVRSDMVVSTKAHNSGGGLYGRPILIPIVYIVAILAVAAQ